MGQEEHPPIAQIQSWTFCFFVSTQISVHCALSTPPTCYKLFSWEPARLLIFISELGYDISRDQRLLKKRRLCILFIDLYDVIQDSG